MANAALLVMAAGLGSRYGGNKQIDRFGPDQKLLMQYSIENALAEGFDKVVFVVRPEHREIIDNLCARSLREAYGAALTVDYAYQDYSSLPAFYTLPAGRTKPYGTVHAVLCAKDVIREPFLVLNADDYYDSDVFRVLYPEVKMLENGHQAAMAAYRLENTLSRHGAVTRGECFQKDGWLTGVRETYQISILPDGSIADGDGRKLDPAMHASMNVWAMHPGIFALMERQFHDFLRKLPEGELKKEYALPTMIDDLLRQEELRVRMRETNARWFGVTYQEDKPLVDAALAEIAQKSKT